MDRAMRRKDRQVSTREAMEILTKGEYGILSLADEEGVPYGIPLSYVVEGDGIYFHCAKKGRKLDCLRVHPQVSFVVVGRTQPVYMRNFTTLYESAMVSGAASPVEEDGEKLRLLRLLCEKYLPEHMDKFERDAVASLPVTDVWRVAIHKITGKAKRRS